MTAPVPVHVPVSTESADSHGRPARSAVGLTALSGAAVLTAIVTFAVGYAVDGPSAVEDNWVAVLVLTTAVVGLLASLAAFVLAIVAVVWGERWTLLWVPLCAFPAFVAIVVLGEAFWWE